MNPELEKEMERLASEYHMHVFAYHTDMEPHKISCRTKFIRGFQACHKIMAKERLDLINANTNAVRKGLELQTQAKALALAADKAVNDSHHGYCGAKCSCSGLKDALKQWNEYRGKDGKDTR